MNGNTISISFNPARVVLSVCLMLAGPALKLKCCFLAHGQSHSPPQVLDLIYNLRLQSEEYRSFHLPTIVFCTFKQFQYVPYWSHFSMSGPQMVRWFLRPFPDEFITVLRGSILRPAGRSLKRKLSDSEICSHLEVLRAAVAAVAQNVVFGLTD